MQDIITFFSNHPNLSSLALFLVISLVIVELLRLKRNTYAISATEVTHLINRENAVVIDVRPIDAYKNGHIIDSICLQQEDLNSKKLARFKKRPLIIVCNNGTEAQKITASLIKQGYNVFALAGGIRAWVAAQLPLVK